MGNYYTPFSLRVPEELLDKIRKMAEEHKRSMNKEIEFVLEQYVNAIERGDETPSETGKKRPPAPSYPAERSF